MSNLLAVGEGAAGGEFGLPTERHVQAKAGPLAMGLEGVLEALPEAVYTTDADGRISFFNQAAADMWGVTPELGKSEFCGSWKLYWPDGTPLPHDECPMAVALRERRVVRGLDAIAERPDGTRVPFLAFPTPIFDAAGKLTGAVNLLVDLTGRIGTDDAAQRYTAIVESTDDAVLAKDLNGTIIAWNRGAERLFGYTAEEAIGKSIAILIPQHLHDEEPSILGRIKNGERIDHYETIRRRKDGSLVEISITVSPVRNRVGRIVGASKIARDITDRRRAEEQQHLLLREMDHRVKNLFALANSVVSLSARSAHSVTELASSVSSRLSALAAAHSLTVRSSDGPAGHNDRVTTLHALIQTIVAPYDITTGDRPRVSIQGPDVSLASAALTGFALLIHEFTTNAAKYGALSIDEGRVDVTCAEDEDDFIVIWSERGGPTVHSSNQNDGFGTLLAKGTVEGQLGGEIWRDWRPEGLNVRLKVPRNRLL